MDYSFRKMGNHLLNSLKMLHFAQNTKMPNRVSPHHSAIQMLTQNNALVINSHHLHLSARHRN